MLVALWTGLGLGFLVAAQVGPIWLLCARSVLRGRLVTGLAIGAGAALVDLAYACLGVAGAAQLLRVTGLRLALGLVGTAVLVALGGQRRHWSTATARHLLEIRPRRHRLLPAKAAERAGPVRGVAWHSLLPQAADLLARRRSPALMVTSADHRQPRPAA
jgi:threonine/homoserine/homoserine lactone efflux protein